MPQFTQPSHRFGPAEGLLDALADALGDAIAGMAGGAAVNGRAAPAAVLRDMGSDGLLAQFHDKVTGVVALSAPSVIGCGRSACGAISANAARRSAWPEARVVTAPTIAVLIHHGAELQADNVSQSIDQIDNSGLELA
jgi:hypothetical protein